MRVIICGAGQVGTTIARHLASEGISVTVIDIDADEARRIDESYDVRGVVGHASHPSTLRQANARDADMLIAVTSSDEVNIVACQVAYSLFKVKRRIARLRHEGYLTQDKTGLYAAEHLPIDVVISPEIEIAEGIAHRIKVPGAFDRVPMAEGRVDLLGVPASQSSCPAIGRRFDDIADGDLDAAMAVVAVRRGGRTFVPLPDDRLELGDQVYLVTRADRTDAVMAAFGYREKAARRILILGAGNVGLHLARKLRRDHPGTDIKLIEQDKTRAAHAAQELGTAAIVLQGDAVDRDLLEEAQAGSAETLVAVTNDDETNIFVSLLAKQAGCPRVVTLVNKRSYETLIPTLGIDVVVSPSTVTISTVLQHVRKGPILGLYALNEDFGEVVHVEVTPQSRLVQQPIDQLALLPGLRIAAVIRDERATIPDGSMRLQPGDHVVALVTNSALKFAETLWGAATGPAP